MSTDLLPASDFTTTEGIYTYTVRCSSCIRGYELPYDLAWFQTYYNSDMQYLTIAMTTGLNPDNSPFEPRYSSETCVKCTPNCDACDGFGSCTDCETGYHLNEMPRTDLVDQNGAVVTASTMVCVANCPDGFWEDTSDLAQQAASSGQSGPYPID